MGSFGFLLVVVQKKLFKYKSYNLYFHYQTLKDFGFFLELLVKKKENIKVLLCFVILVNCTNC